MTTDAPTVADEHTWIRAHIAALRKRIDTLRHLELHPGRGGAVKAAQASATAEKLERRVSRMMRDLGRVDGKDAQLRTRARRLAKSKSPKDRAELVLGALDELPADLAIQVAEAGLKRARKRLGGEE